MGVATNYCSCTVYIQGDFGCDPKIDPIALLYAPGTFSSHTAHVQQMDGVCDAGLILFQIRLTACTSII